MQRPVQPEIRAGGMIGGPHRAATARDADNAAENSHTKARGANGGGPFAPQFLVGDARFIAQINLCLEGRY